MTSTPYARLLTLPNAEQAALTIRAKALIFHDAKSLALLRQVERIACSDANVLIMGESGTGKELVARHIHAESERRGPFVAVNCGAFSDNLIEAELFGHEAGAFTGAQQARAGWFEAAQGGTLFLDEVGDLPLAMQVKLLRVLQERQVVRLGSRRPIPVDVRLVAATNVHLEQAVQAGRFRLDLYYRLNVAPVLLPPLRERTGDILPLVHYFIDYYSQRMDSDRPRLSDEATQMLRAYAWPGNIRELENVVHFALIVCQHGRIEAGDLRLPGLPLQTAESRPPATTPEPCDGLAAIRSGLYRLLDLDTPHVYERIEELLFTAAFAYCQENQVRTARQLGISRNILRTQLKRFGLIRDTGLEAAGEAAGT
ncbi:AAA domain-containing protein [Ideonella dechloratans]|uniref:AAA domain-containing protein n=1 Tax=Ideonella dechloratans TaxID=36863 RepID=A0A643FD83_IDEDE|nr:sigma 54-interacting transcriptional regulator [Ideonella dechloratans]KAB0583005.1 AAA domain-containing protein [Ideonella dechloratans]UFU09596.1 sigma 54-interacting transcriptional regulator [Ideonella dechloratans]